jgi:8-oxo-dGTP pyrophosphatase MutT (NUDIX family)
VIREAVRVLLVTPGERVLLLAAEDPDRFWFPPGGGVEAGEDPRVAARREVREETGFPLQDVGVEVWRRRHRFTWRGAEIDQRERWYLARVPEAFAVDRSGRTPTERSDLTATRWFTLAELDATPDRLVPAGLAARLRALLRDGPPPAPADVGV